MRTAAKLFGMLTLVASYGCSSSSPALPTGPSAEQACTDLSSTFCTKADGCSPLFTQFAYVDVATCKDRFKKSCLNALNAPGTSNTPDKWASCNTAAQSISCSDLFNDNGPAVCKPAAGTLADGAACGDDAQCVSKFCNVPKTGAVCGKCGAPPASGAACGTAGKCAQGQQCNDKTNKCYVPAKSGETCNADIKCQEFANLACNDGKCGPAAKTGEACNMDGTGKPGCDLFAGNFCVPDSTTSKDGKCQPIKWAKVGEKCGADLGPPIQIIGCGGAGTCKKVKADDPSGICLAPAKDGEACSDDETQGAHCVQPASCVAGKCVFPDPATCK